MDKASKFFMLFMLAVAVTAYFEDYKPSSLGRLAQACIDRCDAPAISSSAYFTRSTADHDTRFPASILEATSVLVSRQ
jgi:hypothetical protein